MYRRGGLEICCVQARGVALHVRFSPRLGRDANTACCSRGFRDL